MNKKQLQRHDSLMPNGIPKYVRVYDSPEYGDRFTVIFSGNYRKRQSNGRFDDVQVIGMNESPTHPQGFCQHTSYPDHIDKVNGWPPAVGRKNHLGTRIAFSDLPKVCQDIIIDDYKAIWDLK